MINLHCGRMADHGRLVLADLDPDLLVGGGMGLTVTRAIRKRPTRHSGVS